MDKSIGSKLLHIANYVRHTTKVDVRVSKGRTTRELAACYLFYVLCDEHTKATQAEIGKITGRDYSTVSSALRRNSTYAKEYYPTQYKGFNPTMMSFKEIGEPFVPTMQLIHKATKQIDTDLNIILDKQVRNENMLKVINLLRPLNSSQLGVILERLPPIIKLAH